ncbi:lonely Cys domain-containing protein [Streptomyces sp. NRRL F-5630]|uniref:lonely Cys domain-containing protein n=1 Tax=Streptomyces sp. NRRL F-5630 TaxID=1463864 RepID=UPI000B013013|nr:lonely Cys domain-containing protein [Streptomyces sp. NRRL F-5630]
MTWGDLRFAVGSYFAANGQPEPPLPVALQFLLVSAAGSVGMDLELSWFSIVPSHQSVRAWDGPAAGQALGSGTTGDAEMSLFAPPPGTAAPAPAPAVNSSAPPAMSGRFMGPNDPMLSPNGLLKGPSGRAQGRDWTGRPVVGRVLPGRVRVVETRPGAAPKEVSNEPAPWPDTAYVVAAEGENGRVRLPDGRVLDAEAVADALAADPELAKLPKDVPVVLAIPFAGEQYQATLRAVADRLGRTVWGPSGEGRLVPDGSGNGHVLVLMDRSPDAAVGAWVPVPPSSAATAPYADREWTALDGTTFRDSDVLTRPLMDDHHEWLGRLAVAEEDGLRRRERRFRTYRRMSRLLHRLPAGDGRYTASTEQIAPDPAVYVFGAHGEPGRMHLPLRDGRTVTLGKEDAARYISGLPEVRELPPGHRMHLEVCWSSSDGDPLRDQPVYAPAPHVDDPLGDVPLDQLVSNESRRDVEGSTRHTGLDDTARVVVGAANGVFGRRVRRRPEPLDHELDQLARDAGLHRGPAAVSPETRETTLRLVRGLRSAFGLEVEDDRGVPGGRYERALKGIGALERMRANDTDIGHLAPFRQDMFDFFVQAHTGRAPDPAGYLSLLDFAAARVAADPGAKLTRAVPSPAVQVTLHQLSRQGEQVTRFVQSLPASATFTPRHVASTFWAMVRAAQIFGSLSSAEREAMGRQVLHLDATVAWNRLWQESLWALTAKAIAEGLDVSDRDLLAAYHLNESGAFAQAAMLTQGSHIQGVNWSGTAAPAGIDWVNVRQMTPGPDGLAMRPVQPEWTGPGVPMPLLNVVEADRAGNIVLHVPGLAPVRVSENEYLALLDMSPGLRTVPLDVPVLFLTTGDGALSPELVQRFSQRTGRPAFGYGAPMTLTSADPSIPLGIRALVDPATNAPGPWITATRLLTTAQTTTARTTAFGATARDDATVFGPTAPTTQATDPFVDPNALVRDASGTVRGRDLTGTLTDRVRTDRVRVVLGGLGKPEVEEPDQSAPWGGEAYVIGDRAFDGRRLSHEEFAERLAHDPELAKLPPHVPVVLAIPYAGSQYMELMRAVALRMGRRVWAPSGDGRLRHDNGLGASVPTMMVRNTEGWHGDWVPFDPPAVPAPFEDREWTALDGTLFRDSDVATHPLVFDRSERFGRISMDDDMAVREDRLRSFFRKKRLLHYVATADGDKNVSSEALTPDRAVYAYYAHGTPGAMSLVLRDGRTVWLSAADGGRYIGGLREVRELPPGHRIGLEACFGLSAGDPDRDQWEGRPVPRVEDPLDDEGLSLAQHTANAGRLDVEAKSSIAGVGEDYFAVEDTPGGVVGRVDRVRPEPLDHELDQLARDAELHRGPGAVPPETRAATLRLVRALREAFGVAVEDDRGVPGGTYERVLKGIGALETLRLNDPVLRATTPFRMEMWTFLARRIGGDTPDQSAYLGVLDAARGLVAARPDARLGEMVRDTALGYALDEFSGGNGLTLVQGTLDLPDVTQAGPKDITRAFWATVAAADLVLFRTPDADQENLGRGVLHMAATDPWTDDQVMELTLLAARAHVSGLDITDRHALAAHHLKELGAFEEILTDGKEATGYNWSGRPAPNGVDVDQWYARVKGSPSGTIRTVAHPAKWKSDESPGATRVIWTGTDQGTVVIHLPGHPPMPVPDEELWALLDLAPLVTEVSVGTPVVFPMPEFGADGGKRPQAFSDRTGRNAWAYTGPLDVLEEDPFDPLRITALREKKLGQWKTTVWKARPVLPSSSGAVTTAAAPASRPAPLTRHDSGVGTFHFAPGTSPGAGSADAVRQGAGPDGSGRDGSGSVEGGERSVLAYPVPVQINATRVSPAGQADTPEAGTADDTAGPTGTGTASDDSPGWAVPSWRPAGSPGAVRFASMYRDRAWRRRSADLELAFAEHTGRTDGLTETVRDAVSRMYDELAARHGEHAAQRVFFAPDAIPADPAAELERLRTLPPGPLAVDELMTALTYASYAGPGLPREAAEALVRPAGRRGRYTAGSAYREVHDSRGLRRVGGEHGPALRLLRTYAALGASPAELLALRDALVAWAIPADLQSLPEILRASHRIGLGTDAERDLALRDGAGLHAWVADAVRTSGRTAPGDPSAGRFVPPHRALYAERMRFGRDNTRSKLDLPEGLVALVDAALNGTLPADTDRSRALHAWLDRYGDAGRQALERLDPAHLTALHLYSGADYRLMKAFLNGERFGAGMGRRLVRLNAWAMISKMAEVGAWDLLPMTFRQRDGFVALYDAMWDADDLQESTPEVARLRRRLDAMADAVYEELSLHVDMAVEALEILPPVNEDVWWGDRGLPGPLDAPSTDGPVYGRDRITVPFFRSTALRQDSALGFMYRSKGTPGDSHRGLVRVARSTAREVSPFVVSPLETEVLYPPGASFDISTRTIVPAGVTTTSYESIDAREATPRQDASGAARWAPGLVSPDGLFGIGPRTTGVEGGERPEPVLRPIHGEDGELIGVASFDDADWAARQDGYGRLDRATGFVSWERDDAGRPVATEQALPGGGTADGTFFFASHGGAEGLALVTEDGGVRRDDGSYAGRLLRSARGRGFRSVTVLACGPGEVPGSEAEARARARRLANGAGLPVHLPVGRSAVSGASPHLLEDADGRATVWVTEYPDNWSGPRVPAPGAGTGRRTAFGYPSAEQFNVTGTMRDATPEQLENIDAAEGAPWSVSSWRPAGAPDTPRFTGLYRERAWRQAAVDWEDNLAEALSYAPEPTEAVALVARGVYEQLAGRNGEERAVRAFFDPDAMPEDPAAAWAELLDAPPGPEALDGLMRALVRAAYAGPGLPRRIEEALSGDERVDADSAYRAVFDSRGFRRVGGERGPALRLLRMAAALGLPATSLPLFRAALVTWLIPYDLQSLSEILRASHLIGMGAADERAAVTRDGASLHAWTVRHFLESGLISPEIDRDTLDALLPPHQDLYQQRMTFPFELTGTMAVPDALVKMADAVLSGEVPSGSSRRLQVMAEWMEQYGDRGADALSRLTPAHITALYLYSSYDYRLMKAVLNGERLGQGLSRHLVRFHAWRYILESAREEELERPPLTLVSQPEFTDLYEELSELPDLDTPSPELARLRRRVDMMADRLHDELKLHIDMAIEALEILPSVGRTVWWGERGAPGPLDAPAENGPVYGAGTIDVPFFRSTSLRIEEATDFALGDRAVPARTHRRLIEVRNSTARDGTPFLKHLSEGEALYPPGMRFDVVSRRLVETRLRPPMLSEVAEEATPLPDGLPTASQADPLPYAPAAFEDSVDALFDLGRSDSDLSDAEASDSDGYSDADSRLGDDDRFDAPAPAYPRSDYWNTPWAGHETAPSAEAIAVQEIREDGRTVGKASFTRRDWALREPFYGHLPQATHYTEWSRGPAGEHVAVRRPLPATGESGTFFWTSHGREGGYAVAGRNDMPIGADSEMVGHVLGQDLPAAGFTSITVLACDTGSRPATGPRAATGAATAPQGQDDSLRRAVERAQGIADFTGLDVYLNTGRTAVTPGEDEEGDPTAEIHLLESADGGATGWLHVRPRFRAGADPSLAEPAPAPSLVAAGPPARTGPPWSVPGWRVAGSPEAVRFAPLYREREWRQLSFQFEQTLARKLAADPEAVQGVTRAVARLHHVLAQRHGASAADAAFFQGPEAERWLGQPDAVRRFLASGPSAPALMRAFAHAAYGGQGPVTLRHTLPGWLRSPRAPRPPGPRQGAYRTAHDLRGFRHVGGTVGPALWLLQAYGAIGASRSELTAFRKALLSWSILTDTHSLHEVLRVSHLAGLGTEAERAALARDGARLHQWAGRAFGIGPSLPHHHVYDKRTRFVSRYDLAVPQDIGAALRAALTGATPDDESHQERVEVATAWLRRFGDGGVAALRALSPGHLTALFLYSGEDHALFKTYVTGGRFGEAVGRWMVRQQVWRYAREDATNDDTLLPELLISDEDLLDAVDALRNLGPEATGPAVAEVRRQVYRVADRVYDGLAAHVGMAAEALEILPPLNGQVWWGGWLPGRLDEFPGNSPLLTADTLYMPRFRSTTEDPATAIGYTRGDAREIGDAQDRHPMRGFVDHSTARVVTPFSAWLEEDEVLYAPGMALNVVLREIETEPNTGRLFADYEFREAPAYPHPAYRNAEGEPRPRIVELTDDDDAGAHDDADTGPAPANDENTAVAPEVPAPVDGYRRTGPYAAELDGTVFALHESPGEGDRSVDTLLFALRYVAADALGQAGIETAEDFRGWLDGSLTDDDVSDVPVEPLDTSRDIPLRLLDRIGVRLGTAQRAEAMLLGDRFPASRVPLSPAQHLRVLLADSSYGTEGGTVPMAPLVAAVVRGLGVTVAVADPAGEVTFHGERSRSAPTALLVQDGDRHLAGLPDGPGDTTAASEERLRRVADALSLAPVSVLRTATAGQAPGWVRARIRYMEEAVRFEERLGRYLGGHEEANAQLGVMVRELWERAVRAGRWPELGSDDRTVDGAVGTGRDRLLAVVESGNLRERMGMLWIGGQSPDGRGGLISDLLGSPDPMPEVITAEYVASRPRAREMAAYEELTGRPDRTPEEQARMAEAERALRTPVRPEDLSPPLSEAERALMPDDGVAWIPGTNRFAIAMDTRPQSEAERNGGLVLAGTSGSSHRLMSQAAKMRDAWGLDVDLGLVRLALMAEMLQARHHSLDEIMRGSQLVLDRLRQSGEAVPADLDYVGNWGRYRNIAPLTEAELREHVAVDGKFPDEHAADTADWPAGAERDEPADPADPAVAEWSAEHRDVLEDVLDALRALGPLDTPGLDGLPASDDGVLTADRLERLVDAWFRARGLEPSGSLADKLRHILNDRA